MRLQTDHTRHFFWTPFAILELVNSVARAALETMRRLVLRHTVPAKPALVTVIYIVTIGEFQARVALIRTEGALAHEARAREGLFRTTSATLYHQTVEWRVMGRAHVLRFSRVIVATAEVAATLVTPNVASMEGTFAPASRWHASSPHFSTVEIGRAHV